MWSKRLIFAWTPGNALSISAMIWPTQQASNVGQALNNISRQTNCLKRYVRLLSLASRIQLWFNLSRRRPQPWTEVMSGQRYQYVLSSVTFRGANERSWDIPKHMMLLSLRLDFSFRGVLNQDSLGQLYSAALGWALCGHLKFASGLASFLRFALFALLWSGLGIWKRIAEGDLGWYKISTKQDDDVVRRQLRSSHQQKSASKCDRTLISLVPSIHSLVKMIYQ
jgi:hypothetical protein